MKKTNFLITAFLLSQAGWLHAQMFQHFDRYTFNHYGVHFGSLGNGSVNLSAADLDGDGKKDIVVASQIASKLHIFRNISSIGMPFSSQTSLDTKIDVSPGGSVSYVSLTDFDGDGKLDIATGASNTNMVYVYPNLSTSGTITLGSKQSFSAPSGAYVYGICAADFDGDGKQDIVTCNRDGNSYSYFKNTSSSGSISFASAATSTAGLNDPAQVIAADLNGDGKPDLVIFNNKGYKATILRNTTSTTGTVSFASPLDLSAANYYGTLRGDVGDVDGDGKPDVSMSSWSEKKTCIYRNTTSGGTLSFASKVDFTSGVYNGLQSSLLKDLNMDGKPELIQSGEGGGVFIRENTATSGSISASSFNNYFDLQGASGFCAGLLVEDIDGDLVPDIVSSDYSGSISLHRNLLLLLGTPSVSNSSYCAGDSIQIDFDKVRKYASSNKVQVVLQTYTQGQPYPSESVIGSKISGGTGHDIIRLKMPPTVANKTYQVYLVSDMPYDTSSHSDTFFVVSHSSPAVTYSPDSVACTNVPIVLRTNSTLNREWFKDGSSLGISADSLVVTNAAGSYHLKVSDANNCNALSASLNLSFNAVPPPPIVNIAGNTFTSSASGGNQWHDFMGAISGATAQTYHATQPGQYYTVVTLNGCASPPSTSMSFPAVSVQAVSGNKLLVYPNPNNGSFTVSSGNKTAGTIRIRMFDITGRIVMDRTSEASTEVRVDQSGLSRGTYILELNIGEQKERHRLIINR